MITPVLDELVWRTSTYSPNGSACVQVTWRKSSYSPNGDACVEIGWHKSTHSGNGSACVEVGWHKSSHSTNGSACVEVNHTPLTVAVRDSKYPAGPTLGFPTQVWSTFLTTV
jgi:hypothetical protein